ncbi:MAG: lytic murein transglycosylase [Candidatus Spechtbacterales bacterium]
MLPSNSYQQSSYGGRIAQGALILSAFLLVVFASPLALAQTSDQAAKDKQRAELQSRLDELQRQINEYQAQINRYRAEKQGYDREISVLESEIAKVQLEMAGNAVVLNQTELSIQTNEATIAELEERSQKQKGILADLVLDVYRKKSASTVEIVLVNDTISEFFDDLQQREVLNASLQETLEGVVALKDKIEEEQVALEDRRQSQVLLLQVGQIQRAEVANKVSEKEVLLAQSRNQEYEYRSLADTVQKSIAEIRSQLFVLEGAGVATSFGEAYQHAKHASSLTGVRPAFLLAVLKRESSWGANVGQCYLADPATGMGRGKNTGNAYPRTMHPTRDVPPFLTITAELGRDPFNTPVSCPHPDYGYGGAMGPAQFIPSTWIGYRDRSAAVLGHAPDPWNIRDAFVTSAVKLAAGGAGAQNEQAEWKAAMVYYAGGGWNNPRYRAYGDWIISKAREYQADINILEGR